MRLEDNIALSKRARAYKCACACPPPPPFCLFPQPTQMKISHCPHTSHTHHFPSHSDPTSHQPPPTPKPAHAPQCHVLELHTARRRPAWRGRLLGSTAAAAGSRTSRSGSRSGGRWSWRQLLVPLLRQVAVLHHPLNCERQQSWVGWGGVRTIHHSDLLVITRINKLRKRSGA